MQYLVYLLGKHVLTSTRQLLALLVGLLACGSVYAEGTDSGDIVTNSVTMSFTVSAVDQSASTSVDFTVDRKLLLEVTTPQTEWVAALPGQNQAVDANASSIQFVIDNRSNSSVDVVIGLIDQTVQQVDGFTAVGAAQISPTLITVWEDTNGDGVLDGGENTLGTAAGVYALTGSFAEDATRTISVSIDVDASSAAQLYQTYTLVAAVATAGVVTGNDDSGNISPSGTATNNANDKDAVEIVFADVFGGSVLGDDEGFDFLAGVPGGTGTDDADFDGQATNASGFRTQIALGIAKFVEVIWDPVSGNRYDGVGVATTVNPKAIPGSVLLYVIGVSANSGLNATAVAIDDDIPEGLVDPGNTSGELPANINMPASVDITIGAAVETFSLAAGVSADSQYHVQDCAASALASSAFDPGPEVDDASLGGCNDGDTGYVAYVVTVIDTP